MCAERASYCWRSLELKKAAQNWGWGGGGGGGGMQSEQSNSIQLFSVSMEIRMFIDIHYLLSHLLFVVGVCFPAEMIFFL